MPEHGHADGCAAVLVRPCLGTLGAQTLSGVWQLLCDSSAQSSVGARMMPKWGGEENFQLSPLSSQAGSAPGFSRFRRKYTKA